MPSLTVYGQQGDIEGLLDRFTGDVTASPIIKTQNRPVAVSGVRFCVAQTVYRGVR